MAKPKKAKYERLKTREKVPCVGGPLDGMTVRIEDAYKNSTMTIGFGPEYEGQYVRQGEQFRWEWNQ